MVSPGPDGLDGKGGRGLVEGLEAQDGKGSKGVEPASSAGPRTTARSLAVNIDSSKVCLSCQTHSVAAGKVDVSMA